MEFLNLMPSFGSLVWTIAAFVIALSIIVAVHEYGHYIIGRWCGIHAEVFSLGFGPVLLSRHDKRGTRWQLAAIPFGGFVKFLGDSDAASGKDGETISGLSESERRRTMHGAPLWARAATVLAGPVFNFILTILIYFAVILSMGLAIDRPLIGAVVSLPENAQTLRVGDEVLAINGVQTPDMESFYAAASALEAVPGVEYTITRDGRDMTLTGPLPFPALIGSVQIESAAQDAKLAEGDVILAVDDQPMIAFSDLVTFVKNSKDKPLTLKIWRANDGAGGEVFETTLTPRITAIPGPDGKLEERYLIGLGGGMIFTPELYTPGPIEALGLSAKNTWNMVTTSLTGIGQMITGGISTCNMRGAIGIAKASSAAASAGPLTFILLIASLSTMVGLMNLFPIPVLDGGHLVFHIYEAVTGKPPSDMAMRVLMTVGMALLLSLMVFALGNDIFC